MTIEIIGSRPIRTEGSVFVEYIDGIKAIYDAKQTELLVINPSQVKFLSVSKN